MTSKRRLPVCVNVGDYLAARDEYLGFCTDCQQFTTDSVEPDAIGYTCEMCGNPTVCGAEEAMFADLITVHPK
jgi:hypothetical protein